MQGQDGQRLGATSRLAILPTGTGVERSSDGSVLRGAGIEHGDVGVIGATRSARVGFGEEVGLSGVRCADHVGAALDAQVVEVHRAFDDNTWPAGDMNNGRDSLLRVCGPDAQILVDIDSPPRTGRDGMGDSDCRTRLEQVADIDGSRLGGTGILHGDEFLEAPADAALCKEPVSAVGRWAAPPGTLCKRVQANWRL